MTISPVAGFVALGGGRRQRAEIDAELFVERVQPLERAVDEDRPLPAGLAQQADQPLGLAQRVGADEMGALGKLANGAQQLARSPRCRVGMAEDRQAEGGLGDEYVARDRLERRRRWDRAGACSRR